MCSICSLSINSQGLKSADNVSRQKADFILKQNLSSIINGKNYLLFSIKDEWYLIIINEGNDFQKYYVKGDTVIKLSNKECLNINNKENEILTLAFDKKSYHNGYISLNSDFYKNGYELSQGNTTYFYLQDDKGNKYGESKLTTIINPNPINDKIYNYMLTTLLCFINKHDE